MAYLLFVVSFVYAIGFWATSWCHECRPRAVGPGGAGGADRRSAAWSFCDSAQRHGAAGVQAVVDSIRPLDDRAQHLRVLSSATLLIYWQWRTMPNIIWDVSPPAVRMALWGLFWLGWAMVFASTCMVSHFDLFGLRRYISPGAESRTGT